MKTMKGCAVSPTLLGVFLFALATVGGLSAFAGEQAGVAAQTDSYYKTHGGWELRPLDAARKQGRLVFQSDFSQAGLAGDWKADGVAVELKDGGVVLSLSPERVAANKKYGVLWVAAPFAQPFMIEVEFTLDAASPHDANVFWGQKEPSTEALGKEQECYIVGYFGWGGRCSGLEGVMCGAYGITGTADPKPGVKYRGVWIVRDKLQCLYLDDVLLVYSSTPTSPPASGCLGLSVYQSKVLFHSLKVYSLPAKK